MQPNTNLLNLRVMQRSALADGIVGLKLENGDRGLLPGFTPGAHVSLQIPANMETNQPALWRSYSLVNLDPANDLTKPQQSWWLGIRREESGSGGSKYMHEIAHPGQVLVARAPANHFPLSATDEDLVLIAGGIGITPIATMATALVSVQRKFTLHYTCRSTGNQAYADHLRRICGEHLQEYFDDDPDTAIGIDRLLEKLTPGQPIYICGPEGLIKAVFQSAEKRGWDPAHLHSESFTAATDLGHGQPFEVALRSGKIVPVPADKSLLDALTDAGVFVAYDCRSGYCGLCSVDVLGGEIDHRDDYLTPEDRAAGNVMQACVSRAKSGRLLLDL